MSAAGFVAHYTPSLMSAEALEAIFVKREALAERLVTKVFESVTTQAKHHALIIGPRGFGKTHLLSLVYHRLTNRPELKDRACIAWLREEEYAVADYVDLVLVLFRVIANQSDYLKLLQLLNQEDSAKRAPLAERCLLEAIGERTLVILTENLGDTFDAIGKDGQQQLRALIQNHPVFSITATAQNLFGGVSLRTSPFYGFFEVHHLERLTFTEALELLRKIAELMNDKELAGLLQTPQGRVRVRAIHHLANGTPRIYVILSQFLDASQQETEWVSQVVKGIDDLSPFYQNRMAMISPQQRKIVEYLCSSEGGAVTVTEISQATLLTHQTTSSQLKKLRDLGYVTAHQAGRSSFYELSEPLMRIALAAKRHRGEPIRLFVDFLRCWYSRKELEEKLFSKPDELGATYASEALRQLTTLEHDPKLIASQKDYERLFSEGDYPHALEAVEELIALRGECADWMNRGRVELHLGNNEKASEAYGKAVELSPSSVEAWIGWGISDRRSGHPERALTSFDRALELDSRNVTTLSNRALVLVDLRRYEEALASCDNALQLEPALSWAWGNRGLALCGLWRYEEALESFDKALELEPALSQAWADRGAALFGLNRYEEAVASSDKALELEPTLAQAWTDKGRALFELRRYEKAIASFDRALELDRSLSEAWGEKGRALFELKRYEEGVRSCDEALEREATLSWVWGNRGLALDGLGRHEEALISFARVLELEPKLARAWADRGRSLNRLDRHDEALASLDKALGLDPTLAWIWNFRGLVLLQLGQREEAVTAFDKALENDPAILQAWVSRGTTLSELDRHEDALASFQKVLELDESGREAEGAAWGGRGITLFRMKRHNDALVALDKALALLPGDKLSMYYRGLTLNCLGRPEEAFVCFDQLLVQDPRYTDGQVQRALTLLRMRRPRDAREALQQVIAGPEPLDLRSSAVEVVRSLDRDTAREWTMLWTELWKNVPEGEAPLRLLRVAANYIETEDRTALLSIPQEERKVLLPLLGLSESNL